MKLAKEFKDFVLRGNVVDLAVGIVIGAGFSALVTALVKDMITPLVGIAGKFNFSSLHFTAHKSVFLLGDFLNASLSFVLMAAVIFFFVVKPINTMVAKSRRRQPVPSPSTKTCGYCLSAVNVGATRCPFCTSMLSDAASS